jgi:hypothetical protein
MWSINWSANAQSATISSTTFGMWWGGSSCLATFFPQSLHACISFSRTLKFNWCQVQPRQQIHPWSPTVFAAATCSWWWEPSARVLACTCTFIFSGWRLPPELTLSGGRSRRTRAAQRHKVGAKPMGGGAVQAAQGGGHRGTRCRPLHGSRGSTRCRRPDERTDAPALRMPRRSTRTRRGEDEDGEVEQLHCRSPARSEVARSIEKARAHAFVGP